MQIGNDKRKFMRFDVPMKAEFRTPEGNYQNAILCNVSRYGVCLESLDIPYQPNQQIEVAVYLPSLDNKITLTGEVLWKKEHDGNKLVGLRIVSMDKAAKSELLDYSYEQWRSRVMRNYRNHYLGQSYS